MELPEALARGLDALLAQHENISGGRAQVRTAGAAISLRYRTKPGTGERLILTDTEALAYAVSRMPATFAAVYDALQKADPAAALTVRSLLDVGTGTGAASWAAAQYYGLQSAVCLDVEPVMLRTAGALFQYGPQPLRGARLMQCDAAAGPLPAQADLVVSAYMLGELAPARRTAALRAMWDAAGSMLLLVLPGHAGRAMRLSGRRGRCFWSGEGLSPRPARIWGTVLCKKTTGAISPAVCRAHACTDK